MPASRIRCAVLLYLVVSCIEPPVDFLAVVLSAVAFDAMTSSHVERHWPAAMTMARSSAIF